MELSQTIHRTDSFSKLILLEKRMNESNRNGNRQAFILAKGKLEELMEEVTLPPAVMNYFNQQTKRRFREEIENADLRHN